MSFLHLLTLVLVVLKAVGRFDHSWWIVFAPSIAATLIVMLAFGIVFLTQLHMETR